MTSKYEIKPIWYGKTVAVLASGPSMSAEVAEQLRAYKCIAVNFTHDIAPWADMLVALDRNMKIWNAAESFGGIKICGFESDLIDAFYIGAMHEAVRLSGTHRIEIRNSGLAAIRIAEQMGAAKIILAGFDPELEPEKYPGLDKALLALTKEIQGRGIEVVRYAPGQVVAQKKKAVARKYQAKQDV